MNWKFWKKPKISEPVITLAEEFYKLENWNKETYSYAFRFTHKTKNIILDFYPDWFDGSCRCECSWMTYHEQKYLGDILVKINKFENLRIQMEQKSEEYKERQRIAKELGV